MTRTATRRKDKKRVGPARPKPPRKTSDRAIYMGAVIVGFFAVMLASLFAGVEFWAVLSVAYLALIAYIIAYATWQIYRGKHIVNWQQAMAKIPLRFVGYGTKDGKPLEAAHDHPEVLKALGIFAAVSIIILAPLAYFAVRSVM